ncbi:hypothetical protein HMPREF1337_02015 [Enterococcus faecalis ERV65]|uniref:Uncharacterized protein n=1 Tax=Enterococcus faecalis ERV63 TaxID=1134793 RepID=A0AAV3GJJ4_ENTFL|nr:hypothetical protein HMPREF1328_01838 [Enterococcus faecalis ERV103]EJU91580.1 hypothetical protein HMPREF1329_00221 [Enterococcus faecalis ERV116]EJU94982.1 hypothetical protein HMPREF1331_02763 [Enterococcus faecalis ERV25]EJU95348.1 hypothetical protein HMPREF1330_02270 [Enterococcus faecalis ERV129]EJU96990.1 hypothetical protein HMPREF1332_02235 [Enterococcus faecalis ERV31]EJV05234.1 hypothetical protein HMPREF1333_02005 [Enterococcus faecalis ERV37]EJV05487.1 hypothetical protein HM
MKTIRIRFQNNGIKYKKNCQLLILFFKKHLNYYINKKRNILTFGTCSYF